MHGIRNKGTYLRGYGNRLLRFLALCLLLAGGYGCASVSPGDSAGFGNGTSAWWIPPAQNASVGSSPPLCLYLNRPLLTAHAPIPVHREERAVFTLLYESLTQLDGQGRVVGALARDWDVDEDGRVWTFYLASRRYSDGSRVQAGDVWLSWERSRALHPRWSFWTRLKSMHPSGNEIRITLREPMTDLPRRLCDSRLAVAQFRGAEEWPLGSGSHVLKDGGTEKHRIWTLDPVVRSGLVPTPELDPALSRLVVHWIPGVDSRDFPALGADILWVETKSAAEFFDPRSQDYFTASLGPDSFYALWTPLGWAGAIDASRLSALTVSTLARPAGGLLSNDTPGRVLTTADLWFDKEDPTARELAHGLAGSVSPTRVVHGVPRVQLWESVLSESGHRDGAAFVLRYESAPEARGFHSGGVLSGLITTHSMLVVRRTVTGIGRTAAGGVDLSMARISPPAESVP